MKGLWRKPEYISRNKAEYARKLLVFAVKPMYVFFLTYIYMYNDTDKQDEKGRGGITPWSFFKMIPAQKQGEDHVNKLTAQHLHTVELQ